MPFAQGTLFRLSRDGKNSYVFGTVHLSDPRVTAFRPAVVAALEGSKTLALESIDVGARLMLEVRKNPAAMRAALLAPKDQRAGALLDKPDFADLEALAAAVGLRESAASDWKPTVLALALDLPPCARNGAAAPYADQRIAQMARARGLAVVGLETLIEQLNILDGLPRDAQRALLIATLRQAAYGEDVVETTIARYVGEDAGGLLAWMELPDFIPGVPEARTPPEFLRLLITRRNQRMRERVLPLLSKGGAFIAVGVAHLPGEGGLLRLLEQDGYKAEAIE